MRVRDFTKSERLILVSGSSLIHPFVQGPLCASAATSALILLALKSYRISVLIQSPIGIMTGQAVIFVFFILVAYSHQSLFAENNREKRGKLVRTHLYICYLFCLAFSVFSLFNVVTFKNDGCSSSDSGRNGTCYTSTECQDKGGRALGNCAAG